MRVSYFFITLIILTANLLRAGEGFGQGIGEKTISLELHNESLRNALNKIEELSGYRVAYVLQEVAGYGDISLEKQPRTVKKTLELILNNTRLDFKQEDATILIYRRGRRSSVLDGYIDTGIDTSTGLPAAPPIEVKGRVVNEKKEALIGVSVKIKGTLKGTVTDNKGKFTIKADSGQTLIISYVGYDDREIIVSSDKSLTIEMELSLGSLLNTVVVSTGYQKVSKERFVGSVATVDSALFNREVSTDILSRLNGILPGALFTSRKSLPQIRGISTLNSLVSDPLIILDNFPYKGDINNINPNDVENITMLRDAAAASIWGARAGNGVIVITTKSGKYNQPLNISYTSSLNLKEKPDLFYFPQMNSSDFIDVEEFLFARGKYDGDFTSLSTVVSPVVSILKKQRDGLIGGDEATVEINALRSLDVRNDYEKYVFRNVVNQQHYLNFSGGTSQVRYTLSLGYDNNPSEYQGNFYSRRYSITSNTTFKPYKFLELNASINYTQSLNNSSTVSYPFNVSGGKNTLYPYAQFADVQGNHLAIPYIYNSVFVDTVKGGGGLLDWHYRPLDELQFSGSKSRTQFYNINIGANLRFTSWFDGSLQYQYTQQTGNSTNLHSLQSFYTRDLINLFYNSTATSQPLKYPVALGGILDLNNSELVTQNIRGQLNFNKGFGAGHSVTALVAGEIGQTISKANSNSTYGYDDNILTYTQNTDYNTLFPIRYLGGSSNVPNGISFAQTLDRKLALLANVSYSYNGRYSFYASVRKDGANIYGTTANNKWKPLWSAGVGWDIYKENFYKLHWLPFLKFRSSYGYSGNNPTVLAVPILAFEGNSIYTGTPEASVRGLPNPDLRWEKVGIFNFGIDFKLKRERISGSVDFFLKRSTDVIAAFPVDRTVGYIATNVFRNAANLKASGFDITINTENTTGPIKWNTGFNFSHAKTIVTKYFANFVVTPSSNLGVNAGEGRIAYGLYSYKWAGLDPLTGDPQGWLNGHVSRDYQNIMLDSFQHQVFNGSQLPLYFGNILNSFSFKSFSFSFNISFKFAYYFRKPAISYSSLIDGWQGNADYTKRWQKPGDEAFTTVPSLIYPLTNLLTGRDEFYANSAINVEPGDHIRLQDIRLSYSWANKNLRRFPVRGIQFFVYPGNLNVLLWKKTKSGFDPDYTGGTGGISLPPLRTWAAGISVNLK